MKNYLKILSAPFTLALGMLLGSAIAPSHWAVGMSDQQAKRVPAPVASTWTQSGPCLRYFNGQLLGVCYNGGVFQETFYFKDLLFEGNPIPNGSIYGLQITRITTGGGSAPLQVLSAQITPIFKVQGGSLFGTVIQLDPGYLPYLTACLVAQRDGRPTP